MAKSVIVLTLFLAGAAGAAERLTLEQALKLAEENHPQLQVAGAQIEGARAGVTTAKAYPNPEAGWLGGHQRARLPGTTPGMIQVYSFAQTLETKGVRQSRIQTAELGRASSEWILAEVRLAVRGAVRQTFNEALRRKGEVVLANENRRLVEDLRRRIAVQVQVGEAARMELRRAEAEVAIARTSAQGAELRLLTAVAALRAAVNLPADAEIEVVGEMEKPAPVGGLQEIRAEALSQHPAMKQVEAEIRRAEMRLKSEEAQRTPQPVLRSEYEHQPEVATYRLGFSLPVPVWNKREGPIAEAAAALRQMRSEAEVRKLAIQAALEAAYRRYMVASQQLALYEEGVLKQAEAALEAAEAAHKFGERGILEVLDAQRVLRGARLDFLNAQYDRQSAWIELEQLRAVGMSGEKK
ncbi:MAG: TolC family protein [Acidobacteria bacterium]|nr:TolC family protein [Acidobacteriota bacterium]